MDAIVEAANQAKLEAERLEQIAEELKAKAQAEEMVAKQKALEEKAALEADLEWQIGQLKEYADKKRAEIDYKYGLE